MPLVPIHEMMSSARTGGYAVGYFESWNVESLQGVIDAAEETRSPIIIGFNGEFMSSSDRVAAERLSWYGALGKAAAESAKVPCGFIFNECAQDDWVRDACTAGFNLVMPADPEAEPNEYRERVQSITSYAHGLGVAVEAEIGELPCGATGEVEEGGEQTTAADAAAFVEQTGIDLLAVSVGNVHIRVSGEQDLDLRRLREIHDTVSIPLVLHGGTGISESSLRQAISLGVAKVNYGTYLKQRYLAAIRSKLANPETNPHLLLGMGGEADVMVAGRKAVCDAVLERIHFLGCCGKA